MESNNINRISATGLKSVEIDELTTDKIIINNEGLQYLHKYNILLPTMTEGFYNLQEEMDNIMISNTTQDLELIQLQTGLTTTQGDIVTLGALAGMANINALAAIDLANQKSWLLIFQKPLRSDISNNVYLDFDTNYFSVDASNNLTLNTNYWKKDVSNNLYITSGKVGIGLTNPGTNYKLDVFGNINCSEIYRNGTPISSTLSLFLPLTGGTLTGILTGTTISATYISANTFTGSGASISNLNVSNATAGTLSITRGGIGTTTLSTNQILIGNGSTSILQSANLTWDTSNNTLSASNFVGSGAGLTNINVSNSISGTLAISRGGTGATTFTANQILIGNAATSILQSPNLTWDNTNSRLGIGKTNPATTLDVSGNITSLGGTINGTLNCTTGIFNSISTTGNTNLAIPSVGNFGGTGDKLILYPGTSTTYPYSLGIENNSLWMSSPDTIKFYNNGTNSFLIDVSGNATFSGKIQTGNVAVIKGTSEGDTATLFLATPFNPSSAYKCAIIAQGLSNYSKSKLHFCFNSVSDNTYPTQNASLSNSKVNIDYNGNIVCSGSLTIAGPIINSYWRLTNEIDYCRLYNNAGNAFFKFAASDLWAQYTLSVGTTATVGSNLTVGATIVGATIVSTGGVDFGQSYFVGTSFRSRMPSYFENDVNVSGYFCCKMLSVANSGTDYVGVQINTSQGSNYTAFLYIMYGSFTGFHRCFINDDLFDMNDIQTFKDTYLGRIVISTGKIATDTRKVDDNEWTIKYDKEGITIEDTHPIVQLSRKKKDKRVFGVLGLSTRCNSRPERLIVNSVGEGAIWVCNSNGNIENGDYITSSDYLGYGEKQDDDILHNYTVAKATIDCDFELDSPLYNCLEIENGLRIAFIACTYHSG